MKHPNTSALPLLGLLLALTLPPSLLKAEDWHRITSADGKASVLFPVPLDENKIKVMEDKTPAGKAVTRALEYQDEGLLFTISSTKLPGLATVLAGEELILKKSKEGLLAAAFSEETSYVKYDGIKKPTVMLLKYDSANLVDKDHPGYTGFAVLFVIKGKLYVINSMLPKGKDEATKKENLAAQEKLLKSIEIKS